ncbi:MAG: hypothetical protein M3Q60_18850 [Actinomycetota bacterium]|nr:hypothetical protein [Actinomycetota bacterium]
MDREEAVLDDVLENLRESAQRIRAVSNRIRATRMREDPNHHALAHRVALALVTTEARR